MWREEVNIWMTARVIYYLKLWYLFDFNTRQDHCFSVHGDVNKVKNNNDTSSQFDSNLCRHQKRLSAYELENEKLNKRKQEKRTRSEGARSCKLGSQYSHTYKPETPTGNVSSCQSTTTSCCLQYMIMFWTHFLSTIHVFPSRCWVCSWYGSEGDMACTLHMSL